MDNLAGYDWFYCSANTSNTIREITRAKGNFFLLFVCSTTKNNEDNVCNYKRSTRSILQVRHHSSLVDTLSNVACNTKMANCFVCNLRAVCLFDVLLKIYSPVCLQFLPVFLLFWRVINDLLDPYMHFLNATRKERSFIFFFFF